MRPVLAKRERIQGRRGPGSHCSAPARTDRSRARPPIAHWPASNLGRGGDEDQLKRDDEFPQRLLRPWQSRSSWPAKCHVDSQVILTTRPAVDGAKSFFYKDFRLGVKPIFTTKTRTIAYAINRFFGIFAAATRGKEITRGKSTQLHTIIKSRK